MNSHLNLKYKKENLELRRAEVLKLLAAGYSQSDIAKKLSCSNALISGDVSHLKKAAQRELRVHIKEVIPFEYFRARAGINGLLRRITEALDRTTDPKLEYQFMSLLMQAYASITSMATENGVVADAMKKVESMLQNQAESASYEEEEELVSEEEPITEDETVEPEEDIVEE